MINLTGEQGVNVCGPGDREANGGRMGPDKEALVCHVKSFVFLYPERNRKLLMSFKDEHAMRM